MNEQQRLAFAAAHVAISAANDLLQFAREDGDGSDTFDGVVDRMLDAAKMTIQAGIQEPASEWAQVLAAIETALEDCF